MSKAKTGLLAILVIISCVQAYLIMSGQHLSGPSQPGEAVWFGPEPALGEVCLPGRIYIALNPEEVLLVETFSDTYSALVSALGQADYAGAEWFAVELIQHREFAPGILFKFDYPVSKKLLTSLLPMFYETDFPFASIDCIFVPKEMGPVQFINTAERQAWQFQPDLSWHVFAAAVAEPGDALEIRWTPLPASDSYSVAAGVYDIAGPALLAVPDWESEEIDFEALVRSFYLGPEVIEESDGTEIYTDGVRALRIYPHGAVEYTLVSAENGQGQLTQADLLKMSLSFIAGHGGWPGRMLPTELENSPAKKRVKFADYAAGLPVAAEDTGVAVEIDGLTVSRYQRKLIRAKPGSVSEHVEVRPFAWLISQPTTKIHQLFVNQDARIHIADLALVYYWHMDTLIPAWKVTLGDRIVYAGAADGRVLAARPLRGN